MLVKNEDTTTIMNKINASLLFIQLIFFKTVLSTTIR